MTCSDSIRDSIGRPHKFPPQRVLKFNLSSPEWSQNNQSSEFPMSSEACMLHQNTLNVSPCIQRDILGKLFNGDSIGKRDIFQQMVKSLAINSIKNQVLSVFPREIADRKLQICHFFRGLRIFGCFRCRTPWSIVTHPKKAETTVTKPNRPKTNPNQTARQPNPIRSQAKSQQARPEANPNQT